MGICIFKEYEGYVPGPNTVIYLPLETDLDDHGPNNVSVSNYNNVSIVSSGGNSKIGVASFSGDNRRLTFTNPNSMTGDWTLCVWANTKSNTNQWIYSQGGTGSTNKTLHLGFSSTSRGLTFASYGNDMDTNNYSWCDGKRHMYVFIYKGGTKYIYVDNVLIKSAAQSGLSPSSNSGMIGDYIETPGQPAFDGYISNFIIEDKVRELAEQDTYYKQSKPLYGIS